MRYRLAVEDIEPEHWVAWVLDNPGCFSTADTEQGAIAGAPAGIRAWRDWFHAHGKPVTHRDDPVDVEIVEVFHSLLSNGDYRVNAFFEDDERPLTGGDIDTGLALLTLTRRDLLAVIESLAPAHLAEPAVGETRSSVAGIIDHVATAEWWYLTRLGLGFERETLTGDALEKLEQVRQHMRAQLPGLEGDARITELQGERWSARKMLRRTLWHERDHTFQLAQLTSGQASLSPS